MKGWAALLLVLTLAFSTTQEPTAPTTLQNLSVSTTSLPKTSTETLDAAETKASGLGEKSTTTTSVSEDEIPKVEFGLPFTNPKDLLLQEIRSLDEDAPTNKIQDELAKAIKAEAQKSRDKPRVSTTEKPRAKVSLSPNTIIEDAKIPFDIHQKEKEALKKLTQAETDIVYDDDVKEDDDDDDEDDEDEDDDEDDDEYDDEDDDEDEDNIADEEEIMTQCPDYCRCAGQYAAATTARCSKLIDKQNFGPGIAHLRIENAGEISLGPHALRLRGLQQLESITIADTRIASLDKTAFDGIDYLFAVNLTRNALIDIHPDYFVNNNQLSLLTISGQPLGHNWSSSKDYLLNAPSVTELDFSGNAITHLPSAAFSKMRNLAYVDLKNNRLRSIDKSILSPMDSLVELDLSGNLLTEIPVDAFEGKGLQTLRITDNNLTSLATMQASKLTTLDASSNKISVIAKEDLAGLPALDKLIVSSNGIKRIHHHSFSTLDQLTYLDISDNKLTFLSDHHLRSNPRLQILLMNDNPDLGSLPVFKTTGFEYETYSVYRLECANCGLISLFEGTFDAMPALTRLNLARNRLTGLPTGLLERLSSLRELDLSDNLINTLKPKMFSGARTLSKISLAGNPLLTLQVTPFLQAPGLSRLDVSRCQLQRIWSEARQPLKSLRFLSVRGNQLQRITVEELKATPKLSGLDASHNPFTCDEEFNQSVQWLIEHGVTPTEVLKYISNYGNAEDYAEAEDVSQWSDLARRVCDNDEDEGPPSRTIPHKPIDDLPSFTLPKDDNTLQRTGVDGLTDLEFVHGQRIDGKFNDAWPDEYQEYEDSNSLSPSTSVEIDGDSRSWYDGTTGPAIVTIVLVTFALVMIVVQLAIRLSKRKGRRPVIRPPMILRQGLVDNKNCGLVYKPLQEEIATPHMPKRGSFYSSSTFHYDKIVPESV